MNSMTLRLRSKNRFLCWLWTKVYGRWLNAENEDRVVMVLGWRHAMVDDKWGNRKGIEPCFWWFK